MVKNLPAHERDMGRSISGLGRSSRESSGYPLQYSCLENPMDRGAWQDTVHVGCKELDMTERLRLSLHFHSVFRLRSLRVYGQHLYVFVLAQ